MVLYFGGVIFVSGSISESDMFVLIKVEGVEGVCVFIGNGEIGVLGYVFMFYLFVYCENSVGLDISEMYLDVEVKNICFIIVFCSGVVVLVNFEID